MKTRRAEEEDERCHGEGDDEHEQRTYVRAEGNSEQEGIANITSYCNLLLKGGHQKNNKKGRDELYLTNGKSFVFNPKREVVFEKHGSGCILSSAITSFLALEIPLNKACYKGKKYTENALSSNKSLLAYHF